MKSIQLIFFALLLAWIPTLEAAQTDEVQAATERMRERLSEIDALKAAGKVGENNLGLLTARERLSEEENKLLRAENSDRTILYRQVARTSRQSVQEVGRQRAVRIAELARPGVWLQDARGQWYQKE